MNTTQRSRIVILGSARGDGSTKKALDLVLDGISHERIDLLTLKLGPFDYTHANTSDDFIPLMEKIVLYDDIVLASPIYWYAPSAQIKTFIDRWSDLLIIRKDLGHKLAGKNLFVICSYGTDYPLGSTGFEMPIRMTCDYMNMNYGGCFYTFEGAEIKNIQNSLQEFRNKLLHPSTLEFKISGNQVTLRLATLADRPDLYEWMYCSDASKSMWGAPLFPEKPVKTWDDFKNFWQLFYYQKPLTSLGHIFVIERNRESVGGIAFHKPDSKNRAEVDIWLRSEKDCGKGIGTDAIHTLCKYLYREFGILFFWVMPSARNPRSIATFEKCGFKRLPLSPAEGKNEFGFQDYHDSVYLMKDMSLS